MELYVFGAVLAYAIYRLETIFRLYLKARFGEAKKLTEDPIPTDLWMQAMSYSEEWAREDAMKRIYELYEQHGHDWKKVALIVTAPNA